MSVESEAAMTMDSGTTEYLPAQGGSPNVVYVREPTRWGRRLLYLVGVLGLVVALVFGAALIFGIKTVGDFLKDPFTTQTTDRTGPALLESMQDLSHYVAAEGSFQVLVDYQETKRFVPGFIYSERTLFVGAGTVDAYVDFSALTEDAVVVDGTSVTITLPRPLLEKPSIDNERSYVFAEERGLFNRVGDLFGKDLNKNQQLLQLAEQKIVLAAQESELVARAEKNTRLMLESLLKSLGFERVTVNFAPQP